MSSTYTKMTNDFILLFLELVVYFSEFMFFAMSHRPSCTDCSSLMFGIQDESFFTVLGYVVEKVESLQFLSFGKVVYTLQTLYLVLLFTWNWNILHAVIKSNILIRISPVCCMHYVL